MVAQLDKRFMHCGFSTVLARLLSYGLFEGRPITTKGRWINPFLRAFLVSASALMPKTQVSQPIFIVGTGRSGSTILGKILAVHSEIGWLNEPKLLWNIALPNEDLVGSYTDIPAKYCFDERDAYSDATIKLSKLYRLYLTVVKRNRVLDKYPELLFRLSFIRNVFSDTKFIVLIRNGNDVSLSIEAWNSDHAAYAGDQTDDWWGVDNRKWNYLVDQLVKNDPVLGRNHRTIADLSSEIDKAAVEWIVTMKEALKLAQTNSADLTFLKYEELLRDPKGTLTRLLSFCNLPVEQAVIDYACDVLNRPNNNRSLRLHPSIQAEFDETMIKLGYTI